MNNVCLVGRNYDDKDGKKVYVTEVVANNVQFLDSKKKEERTEKVVKEELTEEDIMKSMSEGTNPYEEFANEVELSDDDLPF